MCRSLSRAVCAEVARVAGPEPRSRYPPPDRDPPLTAISCRQGERRHQRSTRRSGTSEGGAIKRRFALGRASECVGTALGGSAEELLERRDGGGGLACFTAHGRDGG